MRKVREQRRSAIRFSLYIEALGATPAPHRGQTLKAYAIELQQQYEKLRRQLGPEAARVARITGRALIRTHGFAQASSKFLPGSLSQPNKRTMLDKPLQGSVTAKTSRPECRVSTSKREQYNCRRKFRHLNLLSALLHARRLQDDDLQIYPCDVCDGLHVGHDSSALAKRRRRIIKELAAIQERIEQIDRERATLRRREKQLRSELAAGPEQHRAERSETDEEHGDTEQI